MSPQRLPLALLESFASQYLLAQELGVMSACDSETREHPLVSA